MCLVFNTPSGHYFKQKKLFFRFIENLIYLVYIIDHIYYISNESKKIFFAYNSDRRKYIIDQIYHLFI
jgi:hypothetical protein